VKERTAIRQLATSRSGTVLAAGEFESHVHFYDLRSLEHLRSFPTTLDFGGHRLAITDDGSRIIVGAYRATGIAAYSVADGSELWRRKDLKKVQHICLTSDSSRALCCFESGPCESLNVSTGKSGKALRNVRKVWESPFGPVRFLERSKSSDHVIADYEAPIASIPRLSFAVCDASFSESLVCISESGGPVRAFDIKTGVEAWRYAPAKGTHFLRLAFCAPLNSFVGVLWPYEKGGQILLQRLSPNGASPTNIAGIGDWTDAEFFLDGTRIVTAAGSVFDVVSGKLIGSLSFPPYKPREAR
jgi:WD40 repeat protein